MESEEGSFFNEEEKADLAEGHPDIIGNKSANNKSKSKAGSVRVSGMEPQDEENAEEGQEGGGGGGGKLVAGRSMAAGASMNKSGHRSMAKGAAAGGRPGDLSVAAIP